MISSRPQFGKSPNELEEGDEIEETQPLDYEVSGPPLEVENKTPSPTYKTLYRPPPIDTNIKPMSNILRRTDDSFCFPAFAAETKPTLYDASLFWGKKNALDKKMKMVVAAYDKVQAEYATTENCDGSSEMTAALTLMQLRNSLHCMATEAGELYVAAAELSTLFH